MALVPSECHALADCPVKDDRRARRVSFDLHVRRFKCIVMVYIDGDQLYHVEGSWPVRKNLKGLYSISNRQMQKTARSWNEMSENC